MERKTQYDEIARCGWCGIVIGYKLPGAMKTLNRIGHMTHSHPIRRHIAHIIAPLLRGDMLYCPVTWSRVGHE